MLKSGALMSIVIRWNVERDSPILNSGSTPGTAVIALST